jgi:hypothetical protein
MVNGITKYTREKSKFVQFNYAQFLSIKSLYIINYIINKHILIKTKD